MPLYGYRCRTCGATAESTRRDTSIGPCLDPNCPGDLRRQFAVNIRPSMQPHHNQASGTYVTNMGQFRDDLKRAGERQFIETGIESNLVPLDMHDNEATKVTGEGMDATNRQRVKDGLPPVKF